MNIRSLTHQNSRLKLRLINYGILMVILPLGAFLRLYRLGKLPIDGDNSYHALASIGIIKTGIPLMPSGELYLRSVPLLYLQSLSIKIFGYSEWSLCFPSALIGIFNIFLIYVFAEITCKDKRISLFSSLLFAISPWSISLSRIPRMYEAFLMVVLITWIFYYKWYYSNSSKGIIILVIISITSVFIHPAAIIPMCCFLTPLFIQTKYYRKIIFTFVYFLFVCTIWFYRKSLILSVLNIVRHM